MTNNITHYFRKDKKEYKRFIKNGCPDEHTKLVTDAQDKYLVSQGLKLSNPGTTIQQIWATINSLLKKYKSTNIPPILFNNVFITDIQEKVILFDQKTRMVCQKFHLVNLTSNQLLKV